MFSVFGGVEFTLEIEAQCLVILELEGHRYHSSVSAECWVDAIGRPGEFVDGFVIGFWVVNELEVVINVGHF